MQTTNNKHHKQCQIAGNANSASKNAKGSNTNKTMQATQTVQACKQQAICTIHSAISTSNRSVCQQRKHCKQHEYASDAPACLFRVAAALAMAEFFTIGPAKTQASSTALGGNEVLAV
jgi:hypothetical protein